jgi:hypothetical protein
MAGALVTHVIAATTMYTALLDGATAAEAMSKLASVTTSPVGATSGFRQAARAVQTRLSNSGVVTRTAQSRGRHSLLRPRRLRHGRMGPINLEDVRLVVRGDPRACT